MATLAIGLAGAAVGGATLGTGVVAFGLTGPAIGWAVGSIVGGMLFPPPDVDQQGPRLGDQKVSSSAYGQMVPIGYGTYSVAGNLIDASGFYETSHTSSQSSGKGGGGQTVSTTTYTYSIDLAVSLGEGEISGVQQIYANEVLIYDKRSTSSVSKKPWVSLKIYTGSETQLPDPTLEAIHTNVPAYRGEAYVVFSRFELQEFGNRPPNFRFVVVESGTTTPTNTDIDLGEITSGFTYNPGNGLAYSIIYNVGSSTETTLVAIDPISRNIIWQSAADDGSFGLEKARYPVVCGYIKPATETEPKKRYANSLIIGEGDLIPSGFGWFLGAWDANSGRYIVTLDYYTGAYDPSPILVPAYPDDQVFFLSRGSGAATHYDRLRLGYTGGTWGNSDVKRVILQPPGATTVPFDYVPWTSTTQIYCACKQGSQYDGTPAVFGGWWSKNSDGSIHFMIFTDYDSPDGDPDDAANNSLWEPNNTAFVEVDDSDWKPIYVFYDSGSDSFWSLLRQVTPSVVIDPRWVQIDMDGTVLQDISWDTEYSITEPHQTSGNVGIDPVGGYIWQKLSAGTLYRWDIRNLTAPVSYTPVTTINSIYTYIDTTESLWGVKDYATDDNVVEYQYDKLTSSTVTLASIVGDLCDRSDIASGDYDTTELNSTAVRGFLVSNVAPARASIESLRRGFLFDSADTGAKIHFKLMGQTLDRTLTGDDVGSHSGGQEQPPILTINREQEISLPSELAINYIDEGANYEIGTQIAKRQASRSVQKTAIDLPIVLTHTEAAQKADVLLHLAHIERENYQAQLMPVHSDLTPSDVIAINDGSDTHRMRIIEKTFQDGYLNVLGVRDEASVLTSTAAGAQIPDRSTAVGLTGLMQTWILNLPALRGNDNTAGFYAAGFSYSPGWPGGVLMRSTAGEWSTLGAIPTEATTGYCNNVFDAADLNQWDFSDELELDIIAGDSPVSDSVADVLAGANVGAWGVEGRYEIIQWVTATQQADGSWLLSQLLRGRLGTEQYTGSHALRDRFVILDADTIRRFTMQDSEISSTAFYRGVTNGRNVYDDNVDTAFTHDGRALEPWSPVQIDGTRDGSNNLTITWNRRDRVIARAFWTPEMSESTEEYEVDIYDGASVVRTIASLTSETASYSAAEQTSDGLTPGDPVVLIVYQISSLVDRGGPGSATV